MDLNCRLAWLSGFWDGEGSIGLVKSKTTRILIAQLSNTDHGSIIEILNILKDSGVNGRGYTYQERDPAKHRDAHYIRVSGINNILTMAKLLVPFSITKKRQWEIAIEWAESRISIAGGIDEKGHLLRGKSALNRTYSDHELILAEELSRINKRGPIDRANRLRGRIEHE